jgi:hypothetical protein
VSMTVQADGSGDGGRSRRRENGAACRDEFSRSGGGEGVGQRRLRGSRGDLEGVLAFSMRGQVRASTGCAIGEAAAEPPPVDSSFGPTGQRPTSSSALATSASEASTEAVIVEVWGGEGGTVRGSVDSQPLPAPGPVFLPQADGGGSWAERMSQPSSLETCQALLDGSILFQGDEANAPKRRVSDRPAESRPEVSAGGGGSSGVCLCHEAPEHGGHGQAEASYGGAGDSESRDDGRGGSLGGLCATEDPGAGERYRTERALARSQLSGGSEEMVSNESGLDRTDYMSDTHPGRGPDGGGEEAALKGVYKRRVAEEVQSLNLRAESAGVALRRSNVGSVLFTRCL